MVGKSQAQGQTGQSYTSYLRKHNKTKRTGDIGQVLEYLPSMCKALGSIYNTGKKKREREKEKKRP
jgi:hypothetical protein